jgi:hypothetical protein
MGDFPFVAIPECSNEFGAFVPYPNRDVIPGKFPKTPDGDARLKEAEAGYYRAAEAAGKCLMDKNICKMNDGMFSSYFGQLSYTLNLLERMRGEAFFKNEVSVEDIDYVEALFRNAYWLSLMKCCKDAANGIYGSLRSKDASDVAELARTVRSGKTSDMSADTVKNFDHVIGRQRELLIFMAETGASEGELETIFPKPNASRPTAEMPK